MIRQAFVFFCLCGFLAGIPMIYYYVAVAIRLGRALVAGEDIPTSGSGRGIPVVLLFTDRYPPIRDQRLKFVFWLCVFLGCIAAASLVGKRLRLEVVVKR